MFAERNKLSICFVSPHPDDVELYCGGTLLDDAKKGASISVVMMTNGGLGTINPFRRGKVLEKIREEEARARYALIDNLTLIFVEFKDANVICNEESLLRVVEILQVLNPDVIYLPEFVRELSERKHRDHLNTGKLIVEASLRIQRPMKLRCYHSKKINHLRNIDGYFEKNNEAINFYKSQLGFSIGPFMSGLRRWNYQYNKKRRQWGAEIGARYAEGFRALEVE